MDDLFSYPASPGFKRDGTSREAAISAKPRAPLLRDRVLDALTLCGPMTPDECAAFLGLHLLSVRPRFTELKVMGKIEETGQRRANASGMKANVWRVK